MALSAGWDLGAAEQEFGVVAPARGAGGMTPRSRKKALDVVNNLPWERAGRRMVLVTYTYPAQWREWVADGRALKRQMEAMRKRWSRRWGGELHGVWALEFTKRGAPHVHWYVGLPESVSSSDWSGLVQRTRTVGGLEERYGVYQGRAQSPKLGRPLGGEFGRWLLDAWSEVVGTRRYAAVKRQGGAASPAGGGRSGAGRASRPCLARRVVRTTSGGSTCGCGSSRTTRRRRWTEGGPRTTWPPRCRRSRRGSQDRISGGWGACGAFTDGRAGSRRSMESSIGIGTRSSGRC